MEENQINMLPRLYLLLSLLLLCGNHTFAQNTRPKREVRAVWVSTVENIDWPANTEMKRKEQKAQLLALLDSMKVLGINTVFVQVRPASDAFYRSKNEPWSEWLRGKQGKGAGYDPLKFIVDACHERAMEVHAWFNPFRAIHVNKEGRFNHRKHISQQHPEWMVTYGRGVVVNPGIPEARAYIVSIIADVLKRYDIDGIHLDDYFYPYPYKNRPFPDSLTYAKYGKGFEDKGDWRRDNVNQLIRALTREVARQKPYVKFGISPFGVWRNSNIDPIGSNTWASVPSYDSIYADTRHWLKEGWIDYIVPQIYWSMDFKAAPFKELLPWWANNSFGRHVYAGHAVYKIQNNHDKRWDNLEEIPNQIRMVRELQPKTLGSAFFRAGFLLKNPGNIKDSLKRLYKYPSLLPKMSWKAGGIILSPPKNVQIDKAAGEITWKPTSQARYYIIYRFPKSQGFNFEDASQIFAIVWGEDRKYIHGEPFNESDEFMITAVNRLWEEYK